MQNRWLPAVVILGLLMGGCSVYKIDIAQGNVVTTDTAAKLKVGMTPAQVRYLLGSPLVTDDLNLNRWDYVYRLKPGTYSSQAGVKPVTDTRFTVWFENGVLARTETVNVPQTAPNLPTSTKDKAIIGPAIGETPATPGLPSQTPGTP